MPGYDLLPLLPRLRVPTLVLAGDQDFIPVTLAAHIAQAIPGAELVTLKDCAHFSYLECPADVRRAPSGFMPRDWRRDDGS